MEGQATKHTGYKTAWTVEHHLLVLHVITQTLLSNERERERELKGE